jgi:hypothetical protein
MKYIKNLRATGGRFDGYMRNGNDLEENNLRLAAIDLMTVDKE